MKSDCTSSIDPNEPYQYILGAFPIFIEYEEKNLYLFILSLVMQITNYLKIKMCFFINEDKVSFYCCMILCLMQAVLLFLLNFKIVEFRFYDVINILMIMIGVPNLRRICMNFISVLNKSKEILIFSAVFIFIFTVASYLFFFYIPNFYDNNDMGSFATFNFSRFSSSLYSINMTTFDCGNCT